MRVGGLWALLVCLWLCCLGCGPREEVLTVSRWTFEPPSGLAPVSVELPANLQQELPTQPSVYQLRTQVSVPDSMRGHSLVLAFPLFLGRSSLYVNGHEAALLDVESEQAYRAVGGQRFRILEEWIEGGQLSLELRVEHTWTRSGWVDTAPRLSASLGGDTWTRFVQIWNQGFAMFAHAMTAVLFAFYGFLFLLDRRQKAFGWLALEALAGTTYPAVFNGSTLLVLGQAEQLMLVFGLPIALWASVHSTHAQFQLARPPRWLDAMLICVLITAVAAHGPFTLTTIAGPPLVASLAINVLYQMWLTLKLWRERRSYHAVALFFSWAGLGLVATPDMLAWLGLGEVLGGLQGACIGIMLIASLQSVVLGTEYVAHLRRSEDLARQLAERIHLLERQNTEVERLNEELYRQMAARSEQLAQALTRLAAGALAEPIELTEGAVVDERYRVIRSVGAGGMGRVYEVERIVDGMRLALKVLARPDGMTELARFSREAQIAGQLRHPNVVALVDVDVAPTGFLFLVMELVPGLSLKEHAARFGELGWAFEVLRQVAEGITAIHSCGVVHRDLKPANVLIVEESDASRVCAKITDFGVSSVGGVERAESGSNAPRSSAPRSVSQAIDMASKLRAEAAIIEGVELEETHKPVRRNNSSLPAPGKETDIPALFQPPSTSVTIVEDASQHGDKRPKSGSESLSTQRNLTRTGSSSSGLTQTGMLIGTPRYMAPELADGAHFTTPAVDIFSFGVMAYELLAKTAPYAEPVALVRMAQRELPQLQSLEKLRPELSADIVALIERCLSFDPALRPSAEELVEGLSRELSRMQSAAVSP